MEQSEILKILWETGNVDSFLWLALALMFLFRLGAIKIKGVLGGKITRNGIQKNGNGVHPKQDRGCENAINDMFQNNCQPRFDKIDKRLSAGDTSFNRLTEDISAIRSNVDFIKGQTEGFLEATRKVEEVSGTYKEDNEKQFKTLREYVADVILARDTPKV